MILHPCHHVTSCALIVQTRGLVSIDDKNLVAFFIGLDTMYLQNPLQGIF